MKRILLTMLCLVLIGALVLTGCATAPASDAAVEDQEAQDEVADTAEGASEEPIRIAFLGWANNPFHDEIKKGAVAAGEDLAQYNVTVDYIVMGEDITLDRVVSSLEDAIVQQYDGIICIPAFDGTEVYINKAVDAGIPVITCVAEGSKPSERLFFYGQNAEQAGELAGQLIEEYTGGEGKVGVITGILGATQHELRKNGALEYLEANVPGVDIVGVFENNDKAEIAYTLTKDMLTADPDLKCIYVTAGGPFGAAKAIQDLGLTGQVSVIGFDWLPDSLKYVESGEIVALISQDPFGQSYDTCTMMYEYLMTGEKPADEIVDVEPLVVTPDTLMELVPDYK